MCGACVCVCGYVYADMYVRARAWSDVQKKCIIIQSRVTSIDRSSIDRSSIRQAISSVHTTPPWSVGRPYTKCCFLNFSQVNPKH